MASTSLFMFSQVAKHKSKNDCWLVIDGKVLNVTRFLEEHPGGDVVILDVAGKDVMKEFQAAGHSKAAWNLLLKYQVGALKVTLSRRMTRGNKPLQQHSRKPGSR